MSLRGRWLAMGTAGVVIAAAAGCGASGGQAPGAGGGDKKIKIGMSSILSGPAATAGTGTDAGVMAYLKMVNARGGINGYKFTFDEKDNAYDPGKAATVTRDLVADHVFTIVSEGSEPLKATAPIALQANVPVLTESEGGLLEPPDSSYQKTYGVNPVYERVAAKGAKYILEELHQKKAALVYLDNDGETVARDAFPAYYKSHGGQVTDIEGVQVTTNDYTPFAQKLKASGAPVVYTFMLDSQLAGLQKAAAAIGYHPQWVAWFFSYTPGYLKIAGDLATGTHVSQFQTALADTHNPNVKQYLAAMKKYAPSELRSPPAEQGWTFGALIARGVKSATSGGKALTPDGFTAALANIDGEQIGLVRSITYNTRTHAGANESAFFSIEKDGTLKQETPYEPLPPAPASG